MSKKNEPTVTFVDPANLPARPNFVVGVDGLHICNIHTREDLEVSGELLRDLMGAIAECSVKMLEVLVKHGLERADHHISVGLSFDSLNHPEDLEGTTTIQ